MRIEIFSIWSFLREFLRILTPIFTNANSIYSEQQSNSFYHFINKNSEFLKFILAGFPAFLLAILLNVILVKKCHINYSIAYIIVLLGQAVMNFFACRYVFEHKHNKKMLIQFYQFISGIFAFRLADWAVYSFLTLAFGVHFLWIQFLNVMLFSVMKYQFSKLVME